MSGVGKTQFLSTLGAYLRGTDLGGVSVAVYGEDPGERSRVKIQRAVISHDATTVRCFYIDTARECYDTINLATQTAGLEELRDAADKTPLRKAWADRLGYVLGRDYENVSFQELDRDHLDPHLGTPTWHYYELSYQGVTYGPHQMSLGELASSIVLRVLRSTRPGDILLLDEPENFLSPRARQRLLDVIVDQAVERNLSVVIASHSPEIIYRLPPTSLRTIERGPNGTAINAAQIPSQATRALGLDPRPQAILLVEDNFAHRLLKAILPRLLPLLHHDLRIVEAGRAHGGMDGGEGSVVKTAEALWNNDLGIRVLGVLDGDCSDRTEYQRDFLAYLPGAACPENVVLDALRRGPAEAATSLSLTQSALESALRATEGADVHDRPSVVAHALGIDVADLISYTAHWLLNSPEHRRELHTLEARIQALLA